MRYFAADPHCFIDDTFFVPAIRGHIDDDEGRRLPEIVRRLAVARHERPAPKRDERRFTEEQAMTLIALLAAERADLLDQAGQGARDRLTTQLRARCADDAALRHRWDSDAPAATLSDRLWMAYAALDLAALRADHELHERGRAVLATLLETSFPPAMAPAQLLADPVPLATDSDLGPCPLSIAILASRHLASEDPLRHELLLLAGRARAVLGVAPLQLMSLIAAVRRLQVAPTADFPSESR